MNYAIFLFGIALCFIFLYLVFSFKQKEHQDYYDSLYEDEMYKDSESRGL